MKKLALLSLVLAFGCVEKSRDLTRTEREQLSQFVGEEATTPQHEVSVNFENKVELIGYDVSPRRITPGTDVTVTWHWKVNAGLEDGWRLFTHVSDGRESTRINEDGSGLVRDLYQPGRWRTGEYVRDRQVINIPSDWNASTAIFHVGLWNGPNRLRIVSGPSDGDNRARAATLSVGGRPRQAEERTTPTLMAQRTESAPEIDGRLNDAAWQNANSTRAFVNTGSGGPASFRVTAKTLFDDDHFYVGFIVADEDLRSSFTEHDDHLWTADAVEIMVDPDGDGQNYFEMQVSPRNVSFDTRYDRRRHPGPIGHADWDSGLRSAVDLRGTLDDDDDDEGYTVEIAIPWSAFAHGTPPASRPRDGDSWRVNFYVMDSQDDEGQRAAGWSPPMVGDFHVPDRFGTIQFGEASSPVAPLEPSTGLPVLNQIRNRLGMELDVRENALERRNRNRPAQGEAVPTPNMAGASAMAAE